MKVYFKKKINSFGLARVVTALSNNLPSDIEEAQEEKDADLIVLHVTGRKELNLRRAEEILNRGQQYTIIQYVMRSSRNPKPEEWVDLWKDAKFVWSYYDLNKYVKSFYHAPLSTDFSLFSPQDVEKKYTVGSIGNCYREECAGEVRLAAWQMGGNVLHIGENFNSDPIVDCKSNVNDVGLSLLYNQCKYFSSLRRKDGFEIPAIESLLSGVRPIMFDSPTYRKWFDGLVTFIPENSCKEVVGNLKSLFKKQPIPVTADEIEEVKKRFDWSTITKGFWERCL